MIGSESGRGLGRKLIKLTRGHTLVDTSTHLLGHKDGVAVLRIQAIAQLLEPRSDLIEVHRLLPTIALQHIHDCRSEPDQIRSGRVGSGPLLVPSHHNLTNVKICRMPTLCLCHRVSEYPIVDQRRETNKQASKRRFYP